jgi:hypothetical protein
MERGCAHQGATSFARSELVGARLDRVLGLFLDVAVGLLHLAGGLVGNAFAFELFVADDLAGRLP